MGCNAGLIWVGGQVEVVTSSIAMVLEQLAAAAEALFCGRCCTLLPGNFPLMCSLLSLDPSFC